MRLGSFMLEHYFCGEEHYFLKTESKKLMDKKAVRYTAITLGIALCSCSVPHWLISQKNIATDVPEGCGKTVVSIMEYQEEPLLCPSVYAPGHVVEFVGKVIRRLL